MVSEEYSVISWRDSAIECEACMIIRREDIFAMNVVYGLKNRWEDIEGTRKGGMDNIRWELAAMLVSLNEVPDTVVGGTHRRINLIEIRFKQEAIVQLDNNAVDVIIDVKAEDKACAKP